MKINIFVSIEINYLESTNQEPLPMNYSLSWDQTKSPDFEAYMNNLMTTILYAERSPEDVKEIKVNTIDVIKKKDVDYSQIVDFCKKNGIKCNAFS